MRRKRPGHAPLLSARPVLASAATEVLEAGVVSAVGNVLLFNVRPSHMQRTTHALAAGRIRSSGPRDVTISARLWPAIMSHYDTKPATLPADLSIRSRSSKRTVRGFILSYRSIRAQVHPWPKLKLSALKINIHPTFFPTLRYADRCARRMRSEGRRTDIPSCWHVTSGDADTPKNMENALRDRSIAAPEPEFSHTRRRLCAENRGEAMRWC